MLVSGRVRYWQLLDKSLLTTSFFQVTFWSPKWRSLKPWKGHLKEPERSLGRTWYGRFSIPLLWRPRCSIHNCLGQGLQTSPGEIAKPMEKPPEELPFCVSQHVEMEICKGKCCKCRSIQFKWLLRIYGQIDNINIYIYIIYLTYGYGMQLLCMCFLPMIQNLKTMNQSFGA